MGPGRVIATRADVPENTPPAVPPFTTFNALLGNYVVEALGHHRFALYAHLHTGSVRVRPGERVHRGQVLALVGNTGNSTESHLHFHVTSGPLPLRRARPVAGHAGWRCAVVRPGRVGFDGGSG